MSGALVEPTWKLMGPPLQASRPATRRFDALRRPSVRVKGVSSVGVYESTVYEYETMRSSARAQGRLLFQWWDTHREVAPVAFGGGDGGAEGEADARG